MASYACKKCGPGIDVLHGADERMHCSECDAVVTILTKAERVAAVNDWRAASEYSQHNMTVEQVLALADGGPKRPMTPQERSAAQRDADRGRAILRAMEEREKARRAGRVRLKRRSWVAKNPPRQPKQKEDDMPRGETTNRMGDCSEPGCGKTGVYLLSKNPPRCAGCTKRLAVAKGPKPLKGTRRKKKVAPVELPPIAEDVEVSALGEVLRAMRKIDHPGRARVLKYAADWCRAQH